LFPSRLSLSPSLVFPITALKPPFTSKNYEVCNSVLVDHLQNGQISDKEENTAQKCEFHPLDIFISRLETQMTGLSYSTLDIAFDVSKDRDGDYHRNSTNHKRAPD